MGLKNKLRELYDRVPVVKCQGLCQECCGLVPATAGEVRIMERVSGKPHALDIDTFSCAYLHEGRCTIYSDRPLVCRLWGAAENLICPFGCKPDRYLTEAEVVDLMRRMSYLSGDMVRPDFFKDGRPATSAELQVAKMRMTALRHEGLRDPTHWDAAEPYIVCPECHWHAQAQQGSTLDSWIGQNCPKCKAGALRLPLVGEESVVLDRP
jgi:hypothetical protein